MNILYRKLNKKITIPKDYCETLTIDARNMQIVLVVKRGEPFESIADMYCFDEELFKYETKFEDGEFKLTLNGNPTIDENKVYIEVTAEQIKNLNVFCENCAFNMDGRYNGTNLKTAKIQLLNCTGLQKGMEDIYINVFEPKCFGFAPANRTTIITTGKEHETASEMRLGYCTKLEVVACSM